MKTPFNLLITFCLATATTYAETATEINIRHEESKIAELETYVAENPEAKDLNLAYRMMIDAFRAVGNLEPVPDLIEKIYESVPKGPEADLQVIISEIAKPYIDIAIVSDQRDKAKAFVTRIKTDFSESPSSPQINRVLDQFAAALYLPGVGDEMVFAFTSLNGDEVDLEAMRGKVVLVDFWATWCTPCVAEMPNLLATYEEYRDQGFEVIGISSDDSEEQLKTFIEENEITWPQYFDGKGVENELSQRFGIQQLPATFLIGKDGKVIKSNVRGEELEEAIEVALAAGE